MSIDLFTKYILRNPPECATELTIICCEFNSPCMKVEDQALPFPRKIMCEIVHCFDITKAKCNIEMSDISITTVVS